jgi:hypothetical protein
MLQFFKDFIKYAFLKNTYLWFHILVAPLVFLFWVKIFGYVNIAFLFSMLTAIGYEVYEFISKGKLQIIKTYGSMYRFVLDSMGDVIGALVSIVIAIIV